MLRKLIASTQSSVPYLTQDRVLTTLVFRLPTLGAIDSYGNPVGNTTVQIQAYLYEASNQPIAPTSPSIRSAQSQQVKVYKGNCHNPKLLPSAIVAGSGGICTLEGRQLDFVLNSLTLTSMPAYSENFGQVIEIAIYVNSKSF